jgi:catechol 2,3-dioxygenase-like lactoylglutathione lyase family enzyme
MPKALPAQPHIDWLKKAAKQQLDELRARDPSAKLHQAQLAVARDYGFASWRALKAHVDARSLDGQIIAAAKEGRADELDALLARHPDKLAITGSQWNRPLLHIAAGEGRVDCIDVLLRRGFDIATRDRLDNATALHWAAQFGTVDVVKRLVDAGADIDGEGDAHEIGVIGWATCFRDVRREAADYLLKQGAKPTIFAAVALNRAELVRKLVAGDPTMLRTRKMSRFEHHRTPLHFAVLKNRPAMVELLLELGADPVAKDSRGYSALGLASVKTNPAIAAMLIAAGANPNERGANHFEHIVPILNVKNVPASMDYYVDKLGFDRKWDWGEPPSFGCVGRDEIELFLCQDGQGAPGTWISIFVKEVDALYEDYKNRGAIIREPPTDYPWGVREMNIEDLDGHRLRIGGDGGGENRTYEDETENEAA